ncbi:hypothetical protein JCM10295v2_003891 [Rhodotorula toruloides]
MIVKGCTRLATHALYCPAHTHSATSLRPAIRVARPQPPPRSFSTTRPGFAAPALSADVDHYAVLGVDKGATRKQIRDKFYELSRKYHPDAPSTSSETPEQRTTRFQQLSSSYSVLSDPEQRRSYDLSRTGAAIPPHRRRPGHPGYTAASPGMGYASDGGRADGAWTENDERRSRANYAWQHPSRRAQPGTGQDAASAAGARPDPFASRRSRAYHFAGTDHMATYAGRAQTRFAQQQAAGLNGDRHWMAGTAMFGQQKAEEESRLINDSSSMRTGQVALAFAGAFAIAVAFSRGDKNKASKTTGR